MGLSKALVLKLVVGIGVCLLAVVLGSVFTSSGVRTWYPTLNKPPFTPPGWLFGPVWTVLYILMGVAVALVWQRSSGVNAALTVFSVQLVLNVLWSLFFFGLRLPALALVDIALLWGAIVATLVLFWRTQPAAGALLVPYLLWVSFATMLNASIVWLNR
ncbi:MAG: tryptophan-rich sensory protein [bacterium]|jgi:tryptophan-rich sensory protein|nr:tryptophan-rich sensory protein [candidate division KSB1 bacterium]MDH7561105.1 tryptophan-rich sensory protein [bacterium]